MSQADFPRSFLPYEVKARGKRRHAYLLQKIRGGVLNNFEIVIIFIC